MLKDNSIQAAGKRALKQAYESAERRVDKAYILFLEYFDKLLLLSGGTLTLSIPILINLKKDDAISLDHSFLFFIGGALCLIINVTTTSYFRYIYAEQLLAEANFYRSRAELFYNNAGTATAATDRYRVTKDRAENCTKRVDWLKQLNSYLCYIGLVLIFTYGIIQFILID